MSKAPGNGTRAGIPNVNDGSQPTADQNAERAAREHEEMRRIVEADLAKGEDERLRRDDPDPEDVLRRQRDDPRYRLHAPDRNDNREGDIDMVRGGDRAYSNDDWDRSMGPTDPEKRRMLRMRFADSVLPQLPQKAGMRRCWVSTTHNYDTPQFRIGIGYHFCRYEDLGREGWTVDQYAVKDSRNLYEGCVMWREMIAMETDERNWYMIMRELHHDQPYEAARGIYEQLDAAGEQIRHMGGRTTMAPGMEHLKTYTRPPRQFY